MASLQGGVARAKAESRPIVTLVCLGTPTSTRRVETDAEGRIRVELTPGTWVVSARGADGQESEQGRLIIRETRVVLVRVSERP